LNPRPFIRTASFFGPDRRRNVNPNYSGPERRKGKEGGETIPVAPLASQVLHAGRPQKEAEHHSAASSIRQSPRSLGAAG
jgi:hypothetical protein